MMDQSRQRHHRDTEAMRVTRENGSQQEANLIPPERWKDRNLCVIYSNNRPTKDQQSITQRCQLVTVKLLSSCLSVLTAACCIFSNCSNVFISWKKEYVNIYLCNIYYIFSTMNSRVVSLAEPNLWTGWRVCYYQTGPGWGFIWTLALPIRY